MSKKKTKKIFIMFGVAVVIPTATALIYNNFIKQDINYSDLATATLSEIVSDSKLPDKEYSNLDFSEAVLNIPENITSMKSYYRLNNAEIYTPEECAAAAWKLLFAPFELDPDDIKTFKDRDGNDVDSMVYMYYPFGELEPQSIQLYDNVYDPVMKSTDLYCVRNEEEFRAYGSWDYFSSFSPDGGIYSQSYASRNQTVRATVVEEIRLDYGTEIPDKTYSVNGTEFSINQAVEFAKKSISHVSEYLRSDELVPASVVVVKNSDNEYYSYNVLFEYQLDGVPMLDASPGVVDYLESKYNFSASAFIVSITEPDKIGGIFNLYAYAISGDDGELEDKYIPLDKAIESLHQYFAPDYVQKISEVSIKYAVKYNLRETSSLDDDAKIYARPYWCFVKADSDYFEPGLYTRVEEPILIDMQTGEIISYDRETSCYISSFDE